MRQISLALLSLLLISCDRGHSSSSVPSTVTLPPPKILLQDDWASGPSPNWTIVTPTVSYDGSTGNPPGSMFVGAAAEVRTSGSFTSSVLPLYLTIEMDALGVDFSSIQIFDDANPGSAIASVLLTDTAAIYDIDGNLLQQNFTADSNFHTYMFNIAAGGTTATWSRDGVPQLSLAIPTMQSAHIRVLGGIFSPISIDNVLVTVP